MKRISLSGTSRSEWLELRRIGIGGSDAGAICGMNPYVSPMNVYLDKIGENEEPEDKEAIRLGRDLEDYVAKRFMEETGKKVRKSNYLYISEEVPFMLADVDRMVVGERAGLECKTANFYQEDKWKDGAIPESYYIQCQHYMKVLGLDVWYIAVLIMGKKFIWREIHRDEELLGYLTEIERNFWENHVQARKMPDPDGSHASEEIINRYFPVKSGKTVEIKGFDEKLKRREEICYLKKKMEKEQKQIEQELKAYLGSQEADRGICGRYAVKWSQVTSRKLRTELLKQEEPEIYQKYSEETNSSRLYIQTA